MTGSATRGRRGLAPATPRKGRAQLHVALAAVLVGSLLVLAGGAGAANTAAEGSLNKDGSRVLAGADRYATSVALAQRFVDSGAALGDEVIVVSGVTAVDAFAAVGLAASRDVPVLLTAADVLPKVVREFIDEQQIAEVTIVGGTAAVSEAVEDRLESLESVIEVSRISGEDRFDTSAVTAAEADEPGLWCDTDESVMFMIGGSSLADGVAVAPVAAKMRASVLLNPADGLHDSVADVLEAQEVDRVVVVGSEAEVSVTVADQLEDLNYEVTRVDGDTAAARSVALAKVVSAANCANVSVAPYEFALVNGGASAGAATLGSALASSVGSDARLVPVLLVTDELTEAVGAHLGAIPAQVGPALTNVTLHAVGGTAAVSESAMADALAVSVTSAPITATVVASPGAAAFVVNFSAPVNSVSASNNASFGSSALNEAHYKINGEGLVPSDTVSVSAKGVTVSLEHGFKLEAGDEITVVGGKISGVQVADGSPRNDNRLVAATTHTVVKPTPVRDRKRPELTIEAPEGARWFNVWLDEDNPSTTAADRLTATELDFTVAGTRVDPTGSSNPENVRVWPIYRSPGSTADLVGFAVRWDCLMNHMNADDCGNEIGASATGFDVGDTIKIAADAVVDVNGNASKAVEFTVVQAPTEKPKLTKAPELSLVQVAKVNGVDQNASVIISLADTSANPETRGDAQFTVSALSSGDYAGAAGNAWTLNLLKSRAAANGKADISVVFIEFRQVIQVTFDAESSVADIVNALRAHEGLNEHFTVTEDDTANDDDGFYNDTDIDLYRAAGDQHSFAGGLHIATLKLSFDAAFDNVDDASFLSGQIEGSPFGDDTTDGIHSAISNYGDDALPGLDPDPNVYFTWLYDSVALLPDTSRTVNLPAGVFTAYDPDGGTAQVAAARVHLKVRQTKDAPILLVNP